MLHPNSLYHDFLQPGEPDFLKKTAAFCQKEIAPFAAEWEEKEELPRALFTAAGKAGLMGMLAPKAVGGQQLSMLCFCLAIEELARHCGAFAMNMAAHNALCVGHPMG